MIARCWTCQTDHDPDGVCPPAPIPAQRPARPEREATDPIPARWPGWCADCGDRIRVGDLILPAEGEGWICASHEEDL